MSLLHTCYRITDIDRSVAFYEALGFQEIRRLPIRDEATNVFMNQPDDGDEPRLELTFNHGQTEPYELGTRLRPHRDQRPRPRRDARPPQGAGDRARAPAVHDRRRQSGLCFVRDPDGYRIELIERPPDKRRAG